MICLNYLMNRSVSQCYFNQRQNFKRQIQQTVRDIPLLQAWFWINQDFPAKPKWAERVHKHKQLPGWLSLLNEKNLRMSIYNIPPEIRESPKPEPCLLLTTLVSPTRFQAGRRRRAARGTAPSACSWERVRRTWRPLRVSPSVRRWLQTTQNRGSHSWTYWKELKKW